MTDCLYHHFFFMNEVVSLSSRQEYEARVLKILRAARHTMMKSLSFFLSFFLSFSRLDAQFFSFSLLDDFSVFFVRWFRAPFFEQVV